MQMQTDFLTALRARLDGDPQVLAAWLAGSFGRGNADRYSDIDLHLLLADVYAFRASAREWLGSLRPLVLYKLLFDGQMINALTDDGLRIDIWLHAEAPLLDPAAVDVLLDRAGALRLETPPAAPSDPAQVANWLLAQIEEFWRCVSLLPTVIGRNELLVSFMGLYVELGIVTDILMAGYGVQRERGRGYSPANERVGRLPIGELPVDAIYSPVKRVNWTVGSARVGQSTNYDRLVLEIWTDGTITPEKSLAQSSKILIDHLRYISGVSEEVLMVGAEKEIAGSRLTSEAAETPIENVDLSVRVFNSLKRTGITTVGDVLELLEKGDEAVMSIRNFGEKSLDELRQKMREKGFLHDEKEVES